MATFTSQICENLRINKLTPPLNSLFLPVSLPAEALAQAGCPRVPLWRAFDPGLELCTPYTELPRICEA